MAGNGRERRAAGHCRGVDGQNSVSTVSSTCSKIGCLSSVVPAIAGRIVFFGIDHAPRFTPLARQC